jgi:hypothetical protein
LVKTLVSLWTISKSWMAIAEGQGDICRLAKRLIGKSELALLLAKQRSGILAQAVAS